MFLLLQINVTSSPMTCYIFYSQVMMLATTPSAKAQFLEINTSFFQNNLDVVCGIWTSFAIHYLRFVSAVE